MRVTYGVFRFQIYLIMALIVLFDEFQQLAFWPPPVIYSDLFASLRVVDVLVVSMFVWLVAQKVMCGRGLIIKNPISLPIFLFMLAIPPSIVLSLAGGSTGVFFAWKNLVLGAMFFYGLLNAFRTNEEAKKLLSFVIGLMFLKAAYSLSAYALGYGLFIPDRGYVPMLESASITLLVLANLYGVGDLVFGSQLKTRTKTIILWAWVTVAVFLLLTSVSRENWGIYTVGLLVLWMALPLGGRIKFSLTCGLVAVMGFVLVWSFFPSLLDAVNHRAAQVVVGITEPQIQTSVGQHVLDIAEALRVIRESPLLGIGAGAYYSTEIISDWKTVSYGVHNGFLNTWIKFGLLGALAYLAMFVGFARSGWRAVSASPKHLKALVIAPFGTALGMWIMSFLFSPTPFENFQKSISIFFCMAIVYALTNRNASLANAETEAHD